MNTPTTDRRGLFRLADGNHIRPSAITAVSAYPNQKRYIRNGVAHMATVRIETSNQVFVVPMKDFEEACRYRDMLAALVNIALRPREAA